MSTDFRKFLWLLPEFDSAASALSFLRGFTGGQRRVVVRHRNKFYVCEPALAAQCRKRIVASY